MKSAKDPEKFHATRAVRQPNSKILDPSDVALIRLPPQLAAASEAAAAPRSSSPPGIPP